MTLGIGLTVVSAMFIALTIIFDKLTISDFYQGSVKSAWFISSLLGSLLGLGATAISWSFFDSEGEALRLFSTIIDTQLFSASLIVLSGVLASLTLLSYFYCFEKEVSTKIALAIAATPAFVFILDKLIGDNSWQAIEVLSVVVVVGGFMLYEWLETPAEEKLIGADKAPINFLNWPLIGLIGLGTAYLVLVDWVLTNLVITLDSTAIYTTLAAMPLYWIGFSLGTVVIFSPSVRNFVRTQPFHRVHFIFLILALELIGAGFYFFELLGIGELNVTLATLIIGAHVIIVWCADITIRHQYLKHNDKELVQILFFRIDRESLSEYNKSSQVIFEQLGAIIIVLAGLSLWP